MTTTPTTYTGEDAEIWISGQTHTTVGIGDFSVSLDRGIVEQELVGEAGNYFTQGAITIDGSFTNARWAEDVMDATVGALVNGETITISGNCGSNSLHFYFPLCQVTSFDLTLGDASTITEGSVDFTILDPYNISRTPIGEGGVLISTEE